MAYSQRGLPGRPWGYRAQLACCSGWAPTWPDELPAGGAAMLKGYSEYSQGYSEYSQGFSAQLACCSGWAPTWPDELPAGGTAMFEGLTEGTLSTQ
jgi:hypothetical protein